MSDKARVLGMNSNVGPYREAGGHVLAPNHYFVSCGYGPFPTGLKMRMWNDRGEYLGYPPEGYTWRPDSSRPPWTRVPGNRVMVLKRFTEEELQAMGGMATFWSVIAWGLNHDLLPAMGHNEGVDFYRAYPQLCLGGPIICLGSLAMYETEGRFDDSRLYRWPEVMALSVERHGRLKVDTVHIGVDFEVWRRRSTKSLKKLKSRKPGCKFLFLDKSSPGLAEAGMVRRAWWRLRNIVSFT